MNVLLLSAYDAPSHRYWREQLVRYFADYSFTQLTLPARHFSWRVRGNSMSWAWGQRDVLQRRYDLLVATSLVDLSSLRGFVPALAQLPTVLYFHENQFAYPVSAGQRPSLEPQMVNLYSALCAQRIVFNSQWNRQSFFDGVSDLLRRLPDHVPPGLVPMLVAKSAVIPVPVDGSAPIAKRVGPVFDVVWNHRWEYDKGPEILLAALRCCVRRALPLRFHIIGQQFRRQPPEFAQIAALLASAPSVAGRWGFVEQRATYLSLLERAHFVLSTALHEFQGLAVLEAVLRGCQPLVPDRLSYPEWIPAQYCYPSSPQQPEREGEAIAAYLERALARWPEADVSLAEAAQKYCWKALGPVYRQEFERCRREYLRMSSR
jgi:glycosyltransferase involved in cell wall biosynthesis